LSKKTILLYGRTNSGKTAQIGELAEYVFAKTGKKTRLYHGDKGGLDTISPQIEEGIIMVEEMGNTDPWHFLHHAARGHYKDSQGKWILTPEENIGVYGFESLRSIAEGLMESMKQKAAEGVNIGGGSNVAFQIKDASDGQTLKISGSNMAHFGVAQSRMTEEVWQSQRLNADYIIWTSSVSKDDDSTSSNKVLGPDVIGKALTPEVPRWFNLTFRIDVEPAKNGAPEKHILFLGNHVDIGAGGAAGLGNIRMPLGAPALTSNTIEPASLVKALQLIEGGQKSAREALKKRLASFANLPTKA